MTVHVCKIEQEGITEPAGFYPEMVVPLRSEVERLTALCDEYRGEVATLRDRLIANAEEAGLQVAIAQSALTRARAEGMEEERERCCQIIDEVASIYCGTIAANQAEETIATIRARAAKGEQ